MADKRKVDFRDAALDSSLRKPDLFRHRLGHQMAFAEAFPGRLASRTSFVLPIGDPSKRLIQVRGLDRAEPLPLEYQHRSKGRAEVLRQRSGGGRGDVG